MYTFEQTKAGYAKLWDEAKVSHPAQAKAQAQRILAKAAWDILKSVEEATGVPAAMVGVLLYRESDLNFNTYLGNGQSLRRKTTVVPLNRGPFDTFLAGAIDAIKLEGMDRVAPWTIELALYWIERFNGQGYFSHGNSPYVWAWTNLYTSGKFVRDHVFDPNFVDPQGGCAAILKALFEIEPSLTLPRIAGKISTMPTTTPTMPVPATGGVDLVHITQLLETGVTFIPTIAMFFPPLRPVVPFLPLVKGGLKMLEELEAAPHDSSVIADIITKHLKNIVADVEAIKANPGGQNTTGG